MGIKVNRMIKKLDAWIGKLRFRLRKEWYLFRFQRENMCPRTYRIWEYNRWGYKIEIRGIDEKRGVLNIHGWLPVGMRNGDWLIYATNDGYARGVIFDVKYTSDPSDMFFAKVKPIEKVEI